MATVLVVDDSFEVRTLITMFLRRAGHQVMATQDAETALEQVPECPPDVAVLDVALPGMSGLELLRRLRTLAGLENVPAVFVSARGKPADVRRGTALDARYIVKPFSGQDLVDTVDELIAP